MTGRFDEPTSTPGTFPSDVGVLAMDVYFPASYVLQTDLEQHDGVSEGKYTKGLSQAKLSYCTDREDPVSMAMTVTRNLLSKYCISPKDIGRLEVGSESNPDRSKPIKSHIMSLFAAEGHYDVEGVDSVGACYASTSALLNCVDWVYSRGGGGGYALMVATDLAAYATGPARPTGGAAAVAVLIGPDAPLVLQRHVIGSYMAHTYDFCKPHGLFPMVDGPLSLQTYYTALHHTYDTVRRKVDRRGGHAPLLSQVSYCVFHSPFNKLVQKAFARLRLLECYRLAPHNGDADSTLSALLQYVPLMVGEEEGTVDASAAREVDRRAVEVSGEQYALKVQPSAWAQKEVGNCYAASLYLGLASLVEETAGKLVGKRVLMFAFGSGAASSMFFLEGKHGNSRFNFEALAAKLQLRERLALRVARPVALFLDSLAAHHQRYQGLFKQPEDSLEALEPGTFYIQSIDECGRAAYCMRDILRHDVMSG